MLTFLFGITPFHLYYMNDNPVNLYDYMLYLEQLYSDETYNKCCSIRFADVFNQTAGILFGNIYI
jgi:hypothetical protein